MSVQQAFDVRAVTQEDSEKNQGEVVFSTIVKFANARKDTVLLDSIEVSRVKTQDIVFEPAGVELKVYEPGAEIYLPPHTDPDHLLDYLPLLVKSNEERIIALGFRFRYNPKDLLEAPFKLSEHIEDNGLKVSFRINGKYRNYLMKIKRSES